MKDIKQIINEAYSIPSDRKNMQNFFYPSKGAPSMHEMKKLWQENQNMIDRLRQIGAEQNVNISQLSYGQREAFIAKYGLDAFIRHHKEDNATIRLDITKELDQRNERLLSRMAHEGRSMQVELELKELHTELAELLNTYERGNK